MKDKEYTPKSKDEWLESYGFRVPYNGTDQFYDEVAMKHAVDGWDAAELYHSIRSEELHATIELQRKRIEELTFGLKQAHSTIVSLCIRYSTTK